MNLLTEHFDRARTTLLSKAKEVGIADHGTVAGTARELILNEFLAKNLPRGFDFVTGQITAPRGKPSGQIDVLILPHTAPRIILSEPYCLGLVDAVACIVEVKSTLTTAADIESKSELRNALDSIVSVRALPISKLDPWPWSANRANTSTEVSLSHIPSSIVAFKGPTRHTLLKHLSAWAEKKGVEALPNTVTCLEQNYTLIRNDGWMFVKDRLPQEQQDDLYIHGSNSRPCLADLFDYLMKSLQSWAFAQPRTPINNYFSEGDNPQP